MDHFKIKIPVVKGTIGIAADHAGFELKEYLLTMLRDTEYKIIDFGNYELNPADDFPDFVIPLSRELANNKITRAIAICGSGVGACIAANKIAGVRACLIHEKFSAKQGVEDDHMNMICLGGKVVDHTLAWELISIFLAAEFNNEERHLRRLEKITRLEQTKK